MLTILTYKEDKKIQDFTLGGKAKNLFRLNEDGFNVPPWIVLPAEIINDSFKSIPKEEITKEDYLKHIEDFSFSEYDINEILEHFNKDIYFAVRSSAIDEDSSNYSFAGQYDTFLFVKPEALAEKIKDVWRSAFSDHIIKYREQHNLEFIPGVAVIIQEMIPAERSGVAFGLDPVSGNTDVNLISSVFGLGEGLVSGQLHADVYRIHEGIIDKQLTDKTHALIYDQETDKIIKSELDKDQGKKSSLSDTEIELIGEHLDQLHRIYGEAQDIEFAFNKNTLYLLQTRPITTTFDQDNEEYILWDNSNIIESYPGVTTPLTFTFIIKMYESVYRQLVGLMGVKKNEIEDHADIFKNTLGFVRGRVYYNLLSWYKMLAMVPGYTLNAGFMETMMGVKEKFELKEKFQMSKGLARRRIIIMAFKMIWLQMTLPNERKRFKKHLNKVMDHYKSLDFNKFTIQEIIELYLNFEMTLLKKWKAPMINDFFSMIWFGVLKKMSESMNEGENPNLHNDLLCGSNDIISVEPIHHSLRIAEMIKKDQAIKEIFISQSDVEILELLKNKKYKRLNQEIENYLDKFGERCVGELKLETVSYAQDPVRFIKLLKSYVVHGGLQGVKNEKGESLIETELRSNAQKTVKIKLKGKPFKKLLFKWVLSNARDLVSNRENLRYERTRGFGMVRKMVSAIGRNASEEGFVEDAEDIFMLELNELIEFSKNPSNQDIKEPILIRKKEFDKYKKQQSPSERFYTYGHNFTDAYIYSTEKLEDKKRELEGIGACPGKVKAKAQVVLCPEETDHMHGNILITSNTDPGWVKLFPTVSGIIVERGSLLSHSAIVSREMGIPCIVGVTGLLRSVESGDEIIMDGSTGKITILTDGKAS